MLRRELVFLGLATVLLVSPALAQEGIPHQISYQGALTDTLGVPVSDGAYSMTFRLYSAPSGGTLLWEETQVVGVADGRFSVDLGIIIPMPNPCPPRPFFIPPEAPLCDQFYLATEIGGGGETSPRRQINSSAHALSAEGLVGTVLTGEGWAVIVDNTDGYLPRTELMANSGDQAIRMINAVQDTVFSVTSAEINYSSGNVTFGRNLRVDTALTVGNSITIDGMSNEITSSSGEIVFDQIQVAGGITTYGYDLGFNPSDAALFAQNLVGVAVYGQSDTGRAGYFRSLGVGSQAVLTAVNTAGTGSAILADQQGSGPGVTVNVASGDLIRLYDLPGPNLRFVVNNAGNVCADGTITQLGGCDVAENMRVTGELQTYEPGDVLALSATEVGALELATEPYCKRVAGVYSTQPGFHLAANAFGESSAQVPVALNGVVPCKVSAENGPIEVGDLLVSSSTPGYAMKASDPQAAFGAVIGKAMEPLAEGQGTIRVLVSLQ